MGNAGRFPACSNGEHYVTLKVASSAQRGIVIFKSVEALAERIAAREILRSGDLDEWSAGT
jgi:hypothetical protein